MLYAQLLNLVKEFSTKEQLLESCHLVGMHTNETMNSLVAKHAPQTKTYCTSKSLKNRVNVAVGVQVCGYKQFWTAVLVEFEINLSKGMEFFFDSQHV